MKDNLSPQKLSYVDLHFQGRSIRSLLMEILRPDSQDYPFSRTAPIRCPSGRRCARGSLQFFPQTHVISFSFFTETSRKFIDGEPMNPATNWLMGFSYSSAGAATCWILPSFILQYRVPQGHGLYLIVRHIDNSCPQFL